MTITYSFRPGTRVTGVNAQAAGEELARISDKHGELTAPVVVEEARPKNAALHPVFEWNDRLAAELHRQHQARNLIRSVQVVRETESKPEPVYVHVSTKSSYLPAEKVVQEIDLYEQAYRDACERLGQLQHSLSQLVAMAERFHPGAAEQARKAAQSLLLVREELPILTREQAR